jgi:hypothetical protein
MNDTAARPTLIVYRRPSCRLCDDAEVLLRDELALRARAGQVTASVRKVDITDDPGLESHYGRRIPVFAVGDDELQLVTSASQVREFLNRALPTVV